MNKTQIHALIYYWGLVLLAVGLPLSIFITSMAEIILLVNWLAEARFKVKAERFRHRPSLWFISLLYLLHLAGLLYTSDFGYALHDLKIKLPVLLLPLVIGTSEGIDKIRLRTLLLLFSGAAIVSGIYSFLIFLHIVPVEYYDIRDISVLISHIRLALIVNLGIFILCYYLFTRDNEIRLKGTLRLVVWAGALWLIFFLFVLKSATGIVVFVVLSLILLWILTGKIEEVAPRFIARVFILLVPMLIASWITHSIGRYYKHDKVDFSHLDQYTANGNPYFHDTLNKSVENGHYVWLYLNTEELRSCWNQRSDFNFDSLDNKQQKIKYTLIRYLTSKGLRKDCEGVKALTDEDVRAIENGVANYLFLNKYSLYPRLYRIIWEIDGYLRDKNPSGHSIAQRLVYMKASRAIIQDHFIAGVGTGDVQKAFDDYYQSHDSKLSEHYRRRAHNQFVTFFITFGFVGFIIAMFALFAPVFYERKWTDYFFLVFFAIGLLSMLNEDTLETQTGVSFFMFFYSLFLFGRKQKAE